MGDVEKKRRNEDIISMRKNGHTLEEISNIFGLTKERIRQICLREENKKKAKEKYKDFAELTTRTRNAILRAGVKDKPDLIRKLKAGFTVTNIGEKSIEELESLVGTGINGNEYENVEICPGLLIPKRVLKFAE